MTNVLEIALERRASLQAEIAEVDDFVRKAKSWWKLVGPAQTNGTALNAPSHSAFAA